MDNLLYIAAGGASNSLMAQTIHSNNLANVSTPGFIADLTHFSSQNINSDETLPSRVYAGVSRPYNDFSKGHIMQTSNALDLAINGDGLFAVQDNDGGEAYTKNGQFNVSATGLLETARGDLVLGEGGPISVPPFQSIHIGQDGTVTVVPQGDTTGNAINIDRIKLVKIDASNMVKAENGLIKTIDNKELISDASLTVQSGVLEGSNVNAVAEMIDLISLARSFELQTKLIQSAEHNDDETAQIMQIA